MMSDFRLLGVGVGIALATQVLFSTIAVAYEEPPLEKDDTVYYWSKQELMEAVPRPDLATPIVHKTEPRVSVIMLDQWVNVSPSPTQIAQSHITTNHPDGAISVSAVAKLVSTPKNGKVCDATCPCRCVVVEAPFDLPLAKLRAQLTATERNGDIMHCTVPSERALHAFLAARDYRFALKQHLSTETGAELMRTSLQADAFAILMLAREVGPDPALVEFVANSRSAAAIYGGFPYGTMPAVREAGTLAASVWSRAKAARAALGKDPLVENPTYADLVGFRQPISFYYERKYDYEEERYRMATFYADWPAVVAPTDEELLTMSATIAEKYVWTDQEIEDASTQLQDALLYDVSDTDEGYVAGTRPSLWPRRFDAVSPLGTRLQSVRLELDRALKNCNPD